MRASIPILTVVLNNSAMAIEIPHLVLSHEKYRTRDIGGRYADMALALGSWAERVERPEEISGAFARARKATESGQAALLEVDHEPGDGVLESRGAPVAHPAMRIVFPDGGGLRAGSSDLEPLRRLGPVDFHDGPPPDKATLIERLRPADAVILDYSEMDAEVLRACDRLRFISFLGIGYASCIDVAEATRRGVVIADTPNWRDHVAEQLVAMILAATGLSAPPYVGLRAGRSEPSRSSGIGCASFWPSSAWPMASRSARRQASAVGDQRLVRPRRAERAQHRLVLVR